MITLFLFPVITIIGALLHLIFTKTPKSLNRIFEIILVYTLFVMVGFGGLWAFMGHAFFPDKVAASIGWASGSPFQFEVAVANLAIGVLGILSIKFKDNFRTATVIAATIFFWGAAFGHITEILKNGNYNSGNAGATLYFDIIFPAVLIILLFIYKKGEPKHTQV
jgi:hypothetical protein